MGIVGQGRPNAADALTWPAASVVLGVVQELYGILLAYNAVRFLMPEAALAVDIDPQQLSFIPAVRVLRETAPLMRAASRKRLPLLYGAMIGPIAPGPLPPRDGRINPRVVKKKMSKWPTKRPQHDRFQHPQKPLEQGFVILKWTVLGSGTGHWLLRLVWPRPSSRFS